MHRRPVELGVALGTALGAPFATVAAAAAQAPGGGREPTFARVEDAAGVPMANAVVTFVGCLPHVGVLGPRDEWRVQTDARGRAHAKLDPSLCYVAWAVGPENDAGQRAASRAHGWFAAGSVFPLRCEPASAPRRVRVAGAPAWDHRGPLRYVATTSSPGATAELALDDGELQVPHGPFVVLEVQTADGAPLWHGALARAEVLTIPPPQRVPLRVVDERGEPVQGAHVSMRVGRMPVWRLDSPAGPLDDRQRVLGTTDAGGRCEVEVPYGADPLRETNRGDLLLFAHAPGRPAIAAGVSNNALLSNDARAKPPLDELVFRTKLAEPLRGTVGRVPPGTSVHLAGACLLPLGGSGFLHDPRAFVAPVAADGSFVFDQVPTEVQSLRCTLLPPAGTAAPWPLLQPSSSRELPRELVGQDGGVLLPEGYADVSVAVVEPGGGPARGRVLFVTAVTPHRVASREATMRVPLDTRGGALLRLSPGRWVVTVCADAGWGARDVTVDAGTHDVALAMQPHALARFELRDGDGRPIAGARVVARGTTSRGTADPVHAVLQGLRTQWTEQWHALATDPAGRVAVPFVPVDGVLVRVGLVWDAGATGDLTLEPMDDWQVVRPR